MNRLMTAAVVAALALPIVALAALIGEQELRFVNAQQVNVPVRGYDPRDLLRGHSITGQFDWDWDAAPGQSGTGGLCILPGPPLGRRCVSSRNGSRGTALPTAA